MTIIEIEKYLKERPDGWWDLLVAEIPELKPLSKTVQSPIHHQEGDVAIHTRLAIEACPAKCDPDLLWATLLHDVGKPATTVKLGNKITAYKHDHVGAKIADEILTRLQIDEGRKQKVVWAVKNHLFYHSWQLKKSDQLSTKQRNFMSNANFPFLLDLVRVDSIASLGAGDQSSVYPFYKDLLEEYIL
jgi:putative nucleotidyltransferase with HDIG domain